MLNKKQTVIILGLFIGAVVGMLILCANEYGFCMGMLPFIPAIGYVFGLVNWKEEMEKGEREYAEGRGGDGSGRSYTRDWPPGGIRRWTRNQLGLNRWRWK